jgi:hypothetical protein
MAPLLGCRIPAFKGTGLSATVKRLAAHSAGFHFYVTPRIARADYSVTAK